MTCVTYGSTGLRATGEPGGAVHVAFAIARILFMLVHTAVPPIRFRGDKSRLVANPVPDTSPRYWIYAREALLMSLISAATGAYGSGSSRSPRQGPSISSRLISLTVSKRTI